MCGDKSMTTAAAAAAISNQINQMGCVWMMCCIVFADAVTQLNCKSRDFYAADCRVRVEIVTQINPPFRGLSLRLFVLSGI